MCSPGAILAAAVVADARIRVLTHQPAFEIDVEEEMGEPVRDR